MMFVVRNTFSNQSIDAYCAALKSFLLNIMANQHSSKNNQQSSTQIRHRTTTPTLSLILPSPSRTQDDVDYGHFIQHLREPFLGRVRGVEVAPRGIICGHIVLSSPGNESSKEGFLNCVRRVFRRLTWRCWFPVKEVVDGLLGRDYLKDPAESVLNTRIATEWSDDELDV